jgi:hypothetical protein
LSLSLKATTSFVVEITLSFQSITLFITFFSIALIYFSINSKSISPFSVIGSEINSLETFDQPALLSYPNFLFIDFSIIVEQNIKVFSFGM